MSYIVDHTGKEHKNLKEVCRYYGLDYGRVYYLSSGKGLPLETVLKEMLSGNMLYRNEITKITGKHKRYWYE